MLSAPQMLLLPSVLSSLSSTVGQDLECQDCQETSSERKNALLAWSYHRAFALAGTTLLGTLFLQMSPWLLPDISHMYRVPGTPSEKPSLTDHRFEK